MYTTMKIVVFSVPLNYSWKYNCMNKCIESVNFTKEFYYCYFLPTAIVLIILLKLEFDSKPYDLFSIKL